MVLRRWAGRQAHTSSPTPTRRSVGLDAFCLHCWAFACASLVLCPEGGHSCRQIGKLRTATLPVIRGFGGRPSGLLVPRIRPNQPFFSSLLVMPVTSVCLPISQHGSEGPNVCRACRRILWYPIRSLRAGRTGKRNSNSSQVDEVHLPRQFTTTRLCSLQLPKLSLGNSTTRSRYHRTACGSHI
ncbi:hypothetical protein BO78DRAFT_87393 [Aspergillus sclerotiicarbonarius CBS 121057]|uniref:Uncharacterized protein n=1 Tax=Aspergillus sclerotiicarbonarius (strain CBS 121057 / IBT 28362) TaxID=1448318 RepID=A0A319FJ64_ASPSB|nr:hypothetical protein BO78DRAFT_87393 [Aspergillus sclerotiicarbonarius CBS 121057]